MTDKLTCTVTGNWGYVAPDRMKKLITDAGSEEALKASYVSKEGKKLRNSTAQELFPSQNETPSTYASLDETQRATVDQHIADLVPTLRFKNKVRDIVTGELMFCSDERMGKLVQAAKETDPNATEETVHQTYIGRVPKRLRQQLAKKILGDDEKGFGDLTEAQQAEVDAEIREMAERGELPAPAAPKGSKKAAPAPAPAPAPASTESHSETESSKSTIPEGFEDPDRIIEGESKQDRKNRRRREKAAIQKALEATA